MPGRLARSVPTKDLHKSVFGALAGSLLLAGLACLTALLQGWVGYGWPLLAVGGAGALAGGILGWIRPLVFLFPFRVLLEPSIFD